MTDAEASRTIYMAYRNAKMNWRGLTLKLVRTFRRHFRRKAKVKEKAKDVDSSGHNTTSRSFSKVKARAIAPTLLAVALAGREIHVDATARP